MSARKLFVTIATLTGDMGSLGRASNKLICQNKFPLWYESDMGNPDPALDLLVNADSDRISGWDYEHARTVSEKFFGRPGYSGHDIARLDEAKRIEFLREILKADEMYPDRKWTGYRVTGTVNVSNGYPIYTLSLFSKGSKTNTRVYGPHSDANTAMNIEAARSQEWKMRREMQEAATTGE